MSVNLDLSKQINVVDLKIDGLSKLTEKSLSFLFEKIKKSNNLNSLFYNIQQCNEEIQNLQIFEDNPIVHLSSPNKNRVIVNYLLKEKKNDCVLGTNINNRGDVIADLEMSVPYIFKTINGLNLKANINSIYTNDFSFRLIIPYFFFLKNYKFLIESNLTSLNNIKCSSYVSRICAFKIHMLKNSHSFTHELSYNTVNKHINKNFIPSNTILSLTDQYIKHTVKHSYKKNVLDYSESGWKADTKTDTNTDTKTKSGNTVEKKTENVYPFPTSGYYYEIENEISLPFCEARFFKNQWNFLYTKKLLSNLFSYINISNGMKFDLGTKGPDKNGFLHLNNFNFTGSIGNPSLILRGFEYNKTGLTDIGYELDKTEKKYKIRYNYLGGNYFTNIQFILKYIFKYYNYNPILFSYLQIARLSNSLNPSFQKIKEDIKISLGLGTMTYLQKNVALEIFFSYPLLYQQTDGRKFFQVGLNFRATPST